MRRKEKLEAHLAAAQEQVQKMNAQAAEEGNRANRQLAAQRRAARQRKSRLNSAVRGVERLQQVKKRRRKEYVARASSTDPQAHGMRNGEGGTVPSYNVQLVTDTTHGLVVNVEATTDAIDYRKLAPALDRCETTLGRLPKQIVADGDSTNHASVKATTRAANSTRLPFACTSPAVFFDAVYPALQPGTTILVTQSSVGRQHGYARYDSR